MQGFNAVMGFRRTEWRDGFARLELDIAAQHLNRSGIVHGGVLAAMLDATLGFTGVHTAEPGRRRRAVTLSMAVSYVGQAKTATIHCTAERSGGGRSVFMATGTIADADGTVLATGQGVFRYIADEAT